VGLVVEGGNGTNGGIAVGDFGIQPPNVITTPQQCGPFTASSPNGGGSNVGDLTIVIPCSGPGCP